MKKKTRAAAIFLFLGLLIGMLVLPQKSEAKVKVGTPTIQKISGDKNVVTLKWSKVSGAKGYILYYKEKGRAWQKGAVQKKRQVTIYHLKADTVYSFKVKACRKVNGKYYYGTFSKPAKFHTKAEQTTQVSTIKQFLQNAVKPMGSTLYVWGGGWSSSSDYDDIGGHISARTIGVSPTWKQFFDSQDAGYSYTSTLYRLELGLDCSGYVGWCLYNTLNTVSGNNGYVELAQHMAKDFAAKGWGKYIRRSKVKTWKPGDIMSSDCSDCGHVWISLGTCADGSVVALHSTANGGVQLSGTPTPSGKANSQAVQLAMKYMRKYCPQWSARYSKSYRSHLKGSSYLSHYGQMRWDVSGNSVLTDPEGMQNMTPKQVLREILEPL